MSSEGCKLEFSPLTTIQEIQKSFEKGFRLLKIEFYSQPHTVREKDVGRMMYPASYTLQQIGFRSSPVIIEVHGQMTVKQLEEVIARQTGLYVQVFRKSGKVWLETSATDNWTLAEQNEEAEALQKQLKKEEKENPEDHDIW
jgi:hypothetical protein